LLSRPPDQRLLELQFLESILCDVCFFYLLLLLLLFDNFGRGRRATPTARCHVAWLRV
jgi:hypothetical protein